MTRNATQDERFDHDRDLRKHDDPRDKLWPEDALEVDGVWKPMPPPITRCVLLFPDALLIAPPPGPDDFDGYWAYAYSIGCKFSPLKKRQTTQKIYGKDGALMQDMCESLVDLTDEQARLLTEWWTNNRNRNRSARKWPTSPSR